MVELLRCWIVPREEHISQLVLSIDRVVGTLSDQIAAPPISNKGNTWNMLTFISRSGLPTQLFKTDLALDV